ncbi:hypothetical protein A3K73_07835 [Candidatus Pacearchaeota archaeon RBG_13_36_9]|nr:MAG: hypothetical protein A3K73_07835 [Candidatus Pacearchaeota archaeon RBG_13_36_9]
MEAQTRTANEEECIIRKVAGEELGAYELGSTLNFDKECYDCDGTEAYARRMNCGHATKKEADKTEQTQLTLRGHHLYQLYKAYQLKKRSEALKESRALKVWDYLAKNFYSLPAPFPDVSDKAFGNFPEQVKDIKHTLDNILENPEKEIVFTNIGIADPLCEHCPKICFPDGEYSGQDDYVIIAAGLKVGKPYTLTELSKIFSKKYEKWASEYDLALFDAGKDSFFTWEGAIKELNRKRKAREE